MTYNSWKAICGLFQPDEVGGLMLMPMMQRPSFGGRLKRSHRSFCRPTGDRDWQWKWMKKVMLIIRVAVSGEITSTLAISYAVRVFSSVFVIFEIEKTSGEHAVIWSIVYYRITIGWEASYLSNQIQDTYHTVCKLGTRVKIRRRTSSMSWRMSRQLNGVTPEDVFKGWKAVCVYRDRTKLWAYIVLRRRRHAIRVETKLTKRTNKGPLKSFITLYLQALHPFVRWKRKILREDIFLAGGRPPVVSGITVSLEKVNHVRIDSIRDTRIRL